MVMAGPSPGSGLAGAPSGGRCVGDRGLLLEEVEHLPLRELGGGQGHGRCPEPGEPDSSIGGRKIAETKSVRARLHHDENNYAS